MSESRTLVSSSTYWTCSILRAVLSTCSVGTTRINQMGYQTRSVFG